MVMPCLHFGIARSVVTTIAAATAATATATVGIGTMAVARLHALVWQTGFPLLVAMTENRWQMGWSEHQVTPIPKEDDRYVRMKHCLFSRSVQK